MNIKRIFLAFLALFAASAVHASTPGQWDAGQQPIEYPIIGASGIYTESLGDGTTHGGLPPAFALQPADVPSTVTTQITEYPDVTLTASASGTTLTVTACTVSGSTCDATTGIKANMYVSGTGMTQTTGGTYSAAIVGQTGGTTGSVGTYTLTLSQSTISSESMTAYYGATTGTDEFKVRFTLYPNYILPDDPLRNHCSRGGSHLHSFMGPLTAGACSTYSQVRSDCVANHTAGKMASSNPGDDTQCSVYWHPAMVDCGPSGGGALGDGVCRAKKELLVPLYYQMGTASLANSATYVDFPLGLGYVNGKNMDDPWDLRMRAIIANANARNVAAGGTGTRYAPTANGYNGMVGWRCTTTGGALQLTLDDVDCPAGDIVEVQVSGSACWDGKNLYSPSGYDHVIPPIQVSATNGTFQDVCPIGWYKFPHLAFKPQWVLHTSISSTTANDAPYLASDAGFQAKARADASRCYTYEAATVCATSVDPSAASFVCKPGCSFHNDYFVGWMKKYLRRAFRKCLGIVQTDPTGDAGSVDADQTVQGTACDSNTLNVGGDGGPGFGSAQRYNTNLHQPASSEVDGDHIYEYYPIPVPKGRMGPGTMTH